MRTSLLPFFLLITISTAFGQTTPTIEGTASTLEVVVVPKLGFGKVQQSGSVPLNGFINGGDVLLSMKISKRFNLSTGVGFFEFDSNSTFGGAAASLKNSYLHLPLNFTTNLNIFKNKPENQTIFLTVGLGMYGNSLLQQETATLAGTNTTKNLGWNFGLSSQLGAKFIVSEEFSIGIGYESQSDMMKMKKNGFEQKIENANTLYFSLGIKI